WRTPTGIVDDGVDGHEFVLRCPRDNGHSADCGKSQSPGLVRSETDLGCTASAGFAAAAELLARRYFSWPHVLVGRHRPTGRGGLGLRTRSDKLLSRRGAGDSRWNVSLYARDGRLLPASDGPPDCDDSRFCSKKVVTDLALLCRFAERHDGAIARG